MDRRQLSRKKSWLLKKKTGRDRRGIPSSGFRWQPRSAERWNMHTDPWDTRVGRRWSVCCAWLGLRPTPSHTPSSGRVMSARRDQSRSSRPYGFNRYHQVDLKYCRDCRGKKYVFMSMIDCGTGYHQATMLKTRRSEYCATKWHKHWVAPYGTPQKIWHDQGGEFERGFTALLEDLSVASTVTGSHAGWQLSFAE